MSLCCFGAKLEAAEVKRIWEQGRNGPWSHSPDKQLWCILEERNEIGTSSRLGIIRGLAGG